MSQFFASGGQSIGTSVFPVKSESSQRWAVLRSPAQTRLLPPHTQRPLRSLELLLRSRCPLSGSFRPRRTQPSEPVSAYPESAWVNRGSTRPALFQSPPRSGLGAGSENCRVPGGAEEDISPATRFAWPSLEMQPAEDHSPQHALRRDHACPRRGEHGTTIPNMHCAGAAPARAEGSAGLRPPSMHCAHGAERNYSSKHAAGSRSLSRFARGALHRN